jgi:hypothetical protein
MKKKYGPIIQVRQQDHKAVVIFVVYPNAALPQTGCKTRPEEETIEVQE